MHSALRIAEIQLQIFRKLSKAECVSLAQTCRCFYDSALDLVWETVYGFAPLVFGMPDSVLSTVAGPATFGGKWISSEMVSCCPRTYTAHILERR